MDHAAGEDADTELILCEIMDASDERAAETEGRVCYVASARGPQVAAVLNSLNSVLSELQVRVVGSETGQFPVGSAANIRRFDFAIFVLGSDLPTSIAFDLGTIVGARRPVMLIGPPDMELPLAMRELPRLASPLKHDALKFQLETFMLSKVTRHKRSIARPAKKAAPLRELSEQAPAAVYSRFDQLDRSSRWRAVASGGSFEQAVAEALLNSGLKTAPLQTLAADLSAGVQADAAIWVPELEPLNPVIVEMKHLWKKASSVEQLITLLQAAELHIGLIVSEEPSVRPKVTVRHGVVVVEVSLRNLQEGPPSTTVRNALLEGRNRLFHAVEEN